MGELHRPERRAAVLYARYNVPAHPLTVLFKRVENL